MPDERAERERQAREAREPIPWEELSDSGRDLLREVAALLIERHTGRVSFELVLGGVRGDIDLHTRRTLGRKRSA